MKLGQVFKISTGQLVKRLEDINGEKFNVLKLASINEQGKFTNIYDSLNLSGSITKLSLNDIIVKNNGTNIVAVVDEELVGYVLSSEYLIFRANIPINKYQAHFYATYINKVLSRQNKAEGTVMMRLKVNDLNEIANPNVNNMEQIGKYIYLCSEYKKLQEEYFIWQNMKHDYLIDLALKEENNG